MKHDFALPPRRYVIRLPTNLPMDAAAPLLCAGITTWSPLQYYGLNKKGMSLGVIGLGGLGHMAVKFGKALGMKVCGHLAACCEDPVLLTTAISHMCTKGGHMARP